MCIYFVPGDKSDVRNKQKELSKSVPETSIFVFVPGNEQKGTNLGTSGNRCYDWLKCIRGQTGKQSVPMVKTPETLALISFSLSFSLFVPSLYKVKEKRK